MWVSLAGPVFHLVQIWLIIGLIGQWMAQNLWRDYVSDAWCSCREHQKNLSHDIKSQSGLRLFGFRSLLAAHSPETDSLHLSLPCKSWMNWIISDLKFGFKIVYFGSCPWRRGPVIECFRFHWLDRPGFKVVEQVLRLMLLQLARFIGTSWFYYGTLAEGSASFITD